MNKSRLVQLFVASRRNKLSSQEREEFNQLRFYYTDFYNYLVENYQDESLLNELEKRDPQRGLNKVKLSTHNKKIRFFYASAALLAGILLTTYLIFPKSNQDKAVVLSEVNTTKVIKNRATLMTSNGIYDLTKNKEELINNEGIHVSDDFDLKYQREPEKNEIHTVMTPYLSQYSLTLSDGSVIYLNSNTKLRYPTFFNGRTREIFVQGEIYCEIKKSDKPFIIHTPVDTVTVLGTEFNVRAYKNEGYREITLVEGSVKIDNGSNHTLLSPGQQLISQKNYQIANVDAESYSNWRKEYNQFYHIKIERFLNSLSQMYNVKFIYSDNLLKDQYITGGIIKSATLKNNLSLLKEGCGLYFQVKEHHIVVSNAIN